MTKQELKLKQRKSWLKRKYGLTPEQYYALERIQGGCGVCGKQYKEKFYCVDHDHRTGAVRGLLCTRCNRALGLFGDDIPGLEQAINYLKDSGYRQVFLELTPPSI